MKALGEDDGGWGGVGGKQNPEGSIWGAGQSSCEKDGRRKYRHRKRIDPNVWQDLEKDANHSTEATMRESSGCNRRRTRCEGPTLWKLLVGSTALLRYITDRYLLHVSHIMNQR